MAKEAPFSTFLLQDGRKLGYIDYGDPKGKPILFFHGWPGTRLDLYCFQEETKKLGVRFIGVDRPGMSYSTYQRKRTISDWPNDVLELVSFLNLEKFSILGFSTGGLYAIECLHTMSDKINRIGLVSAVPYYSIDFPKEDLTRELKVLEKMANYPALLKLICRIGTRIGLGNYRRKPVKEYKNSMATMPTIDQKIWSSERIKKWFLEIYIPDLLSSSIKGVAHDLFLLFSWLKNPKVNRKKITSHREVSIWHGKEDNVVPVKASERQSCYFERVETIYYPKEGHKIIYTHYEEILKSLLND
jgi:pimeloyl-ACP methyl ester carboxylesterase